MKPLIFNTVILVMAFAPAAAGAKGCIKGAIIGGIAGHMAGHGKVGAVAGCIVGRHGANKRDAEKADQKTSGEPAPQAALPAPGAGAASRGARNWLSNA